MAAAKRREALVVLDEPRIQRRCPRAMHICQDYFNRHVGLTLGLASYPGYSVS